MLIPPEVRAVARRWGVPVSSIELTPDGFLVAYTGPDWGQLEIYFEEEWC